MRATAFTRVIRRGGRLYVAYWLYYPDSNTVLAGSDKLWERSWLLPRIRNLIEGTPDYPGFHRDDWEAVFARVDPDGTIWMRASSHGHFQGCKWRSCHDSWLRSTGWVRVSRGSHSGHVPYRERVGMARCRDRPGSRRGTCRGPRAPAAVPSSPAAASTSGAAPARASGWSRSRRSTAAATSRSTRA